MPGAFKLDHLQPLPPILLKDFSNLLGRVLAIAPAAARLLAFTISFARQMNEIFTV